MLRVLKKIISVIIYAFGIIFIILGAIPLALQVGIAEECETVTAIVIKSDDDELEIKYDYDNKSYFDTINVSELDKNAKEIIIYLDPQEPSKAIYCDSFVPSMNLMAGFGFMLVGAMLNIKTDKSNKKSRNKNFEIINSDNNVIKADINSEINTEMSNKKPILAKIIMISTDYSNMINNKYMHRIVCTYIDENYCKHTFISDSTSKASENLVGKDIVVYVDKFDYEKYKVDLNSIN